MRTNLEFLGVEIEFKSWGFYILCSSECESVYGVSTIKCF